MPDALRSSVLILLSTLLTWSANNVGGLGAVTASASVTMLAALAHKQSAAAVMCASFAGWASSEVIPDVLWASALGAVTALTFQAFVVLKIGEGWGGRLGLIAFIAVNLTAVCQDLGRVEHLFEGERYAVVSGDATVWFVFVCLASTTFGSFTTIYLRCNVPSLDNPAAAAAFVGLLGALVMSGIPTSLLFANFGGKSGEVSAAVYGGAFVGMSAKNHVPNYLAFLATGVLAGGLSVALRGVFVDGIGGKYGAMAFLSVGIYKAARGLFSGGPAVREPAPKSESRSRRSYLSTRLTMVRSPSMLPFDGGGEETVSSAAEKRGTHAQV